MGPHRLTSPEQTLIIRSIIGTWSSGFPWGLHVKRSTVKVFSKIVYVLRKSPITRSTWILTCAIPLVFSTSIGSSCSFPFVNAGITSCAYFRATPSWIVNPLSAITKSPESNLSRKPQFSVRCLSEVRPPQASETNEMQPWGVMPIKTFTQGSHAPWKSLKVLEF